MENSKLLDPNVEAYLIKGKNAPNAIIQDENKNTLAMIKGTWAREGCTLVAPDDQILIRIRSISMWNLDMTMEDSEKKIIGVIKNENGTLVLTDKNQDIILTGTAFIGKSPCCKIIDKNQNLVASFSMLVTGNKRQRWFGSWSDQYVLHVHDIAFPRLFLLGFFAYVHYDLTKKKTSIPPNPV